MNRKARIGAEKASRVPWTICRGARQVCFTETIYPLRTTQKAACCLVNVDAISRPKGVIKKPYNHC